MTESSIPVARILSLSGIDFARTVCPDEIIKSETPLLLLPLIKIFEVLAKKPNRSRKGFKKLSIIIILINIRILEIFTGFDVFYYMYFVY